MIKIPIAPWKTNSFPIESCKNVRVSLQVQALTFQMWNETMFYNRDLKFWAEIHLDVTLEIPQVGWRGPKGPFGWWKGKDFTLCRQKPTMPDWRGETWGATATSIYDAFAQMLMSFLPFALLTRVDLDEDITNGHDLCPKPCSRVWNGL